MSGLERSSIVGALSPEDQRRFEALSMTDLIRLQDRLSEILQRRYGARMALAFTDIVDSTARFLQYGDDAGRRVQHRHFELLQSVVEAHGGRIVDTAGDGAFLCFPAVEPALMALVELQKGIRERNAARSEGDQFSVRSGLHWGEVLSDGVLVQGSSVNLCARVTGSSGQAEIRLTEEAFKNLPAAAKVRCKPLPPVTLKGFPEPESLLLYEWRDEPSIPALVRVEEGGRIHALPDKPLISFGRAAESGPRANDVVLSHPEDKLTQQISRWHFVLRREKDGLVLRNDSRDTVVDGTPLPTGGEAPVRVGTVVRVSSVLTLQFLGEREPATTGQAMVTLFTV